MNDGKRKALEAAGFVFEDAEDFLDLDPVERLLVEVRVAISRAIRTRREEQHLTQKQVAAKLKTSQPRFAKIEAGSPDVSLDLMLRGLFTLGGSMEDLGEWHGGPKARSKRSGRTQRDREPRG